MPTRSATRLVFASCSFLPSEHSSFACAGARAIQPLALLDFGGDGQEPLAADDTEAFNGASALASPERKQFFLFNQVSVSLLGSEGVADNTARDEIFG